MFIGADLIINVAGEPYFKMVYSILHQHPITRCDSHFWDDCYREFFFCIKRDVGNGQENSIKDHSSTHFKLQTVVT